MTTNLAIETSANERLATLTGTTQDYLSDALQRFDHDKIAISFSGAEDIILVDLMHQIGLKCAVFSLDTARLHPETYAYFEAVRDHYGIAIEVVMPEASAVESLVREKGLFSFYKEGHAECCAVRKIAPLRRKLDRLDAWITGQRRDQSVTRGNVPIEQVDLAFSNDQRELVKFNPLADWTSNDVWQYIRSNQVPFNPLHNQGFVSIGCQPCTRPVAPHEHERAGRWWWEESTIKECGLHAQNLEPVSTIQQT